MALPWAPSCRPSAVALLARECRSRGAARFLSPSSTSARGEARTRPTLLLFVLAPLLLISASEAATLSTCCITRFAVQYCARRAWHNGRSCLPTPLIRRLRCWDAPHTGESPRPPPRQGPQAALYNPPQVEEAACPERSRSGPDENPRRNNNHRRRNKPASCWALPSATLLSICTLPALWRSGQLSAAQPPNLAQALYPLACRQRAVLSSFPSSLRARGALSPRARGGAVQFPMEASFLCSAATHTLREAGTLNTPHSTRLVFFFHSLPGR